MQISWTAFDNLEATFFGLLEDCVGAEHSGHHDNHFFENGKVRKCTELELFFKGDIL